MRKYRRAFIITTFTALFMVLASCGESQSEKTERVNPLLNLKPKVLFTFDGGIDNQGTLGGDVLTDQQNISWEQGMQGQAAAFISQNGSASYFRIEDLKLNKATDFTIQLWVKMPRDAPHQTVLVTQKKFPSTNLKSQKNPGWAFYTSGGTWAWNMGSGDRRITYERSNSEHMPLNDGKWHQLLMSYNSYLGEVRLYYDGVNRAIYNISDEEGFDFTNAASLVVGSKNINNNAEAEERALISQGADSLQALVEEFNRLSSKHGLRDVASEEFESLIVEPKKLFQRKFTKSVERVDFSRIEQLEENLMDNPYTVHQVKDFMEVAPLLQLYSLVDGQVVINEKVVQSKAKSVVLHRPNFSIDNLAVWEQTLSADEIRKSYNAYFDTETSKVNQHVSSITAGVWNIHHGGIHATKEKDGWDSRQRIVEIIKKEKVDVLMMQETYSSGDYIAAELGYYFATTVDWDYLNQGSNISVLSRYPIEEVFVPQTATFMNVGTKISISENQKMYVMSNWYGMRQFGNVFDFQRQRFQQSDSLPVLFGGDFNAVPHTDGGDSPASQKLLDNSFIDAFRSTYPDVQQHPGHTHISDRRIDQLYYKGRALKNTSTMQITTWPSGFPSDHALIKSTFKLK